MAAVVCSTVVLRCCVLTAGDWEDGSRHGTGKLTLPNAVTYEGAFYAGLRHGTGTVTVPDGGISFSGEWIEDSPVGKFFASRVEVW